MKRCRKTFAIIEPVFMDVCDKMKEYERKTNCLAEKTRTQSHIDSMVADILERTGVLLDPNRGVPYMEIMDNEKFIMTKLQYG